MDYTQAFILAIVEGITEFLPISSTGHLVLTAQLLNIPQTEFVKSFEVFIQLGAILAIVVLYGKTVLRNIEVWKKISVAFLPTAAIGFTLYQLIKDALLGNTAITLVALFFGGIVLIALELLYKEKQHHTGSIKDITTKQAFLIGLFQAISMIPGVSRAAATIIGGLMLGTNRKTAVEFSFLLAIPTMLAATTFDLFKSNFIFTPSEYNLLAIGFVGSFIVATITVKFFLHLIESHTFVSFGIYRIALAVLFWLFVRT